MSPLLKFMLRRLALIPLTLLIVTAVLYGIVMFTPPEVRAQLYLSNSNGIDRMSAEQLQRLIERIIRDILDTGPVDTLLRHLAEAHEGQWKGAGLV